MRTREIPVRIREKTGTDAAAWVADLDGRIVGHVALHCPAQAPALGRRAVLDVGQTLRSAVALYEAEGWSRVGELHLPLGPEIMLDLWVYVSPEPPDARRTGGGAPATGRPPLSARSYAGQQVECSRAPTGAVAASSL